MCDAHVATRNIEIYCIFSCYLNINYKIDVSLIVEQMCKNLSPTKTRRGNCLVLPHTGYALEYDHHVTSLLQDLHWLRVPEHLTYKLCSLHGATPRYQSELVQPISNIDSRCHLRSASTTDIVVPATRRRTISERAFAVAGPRACNSLPPDVRSAEYVNGCKKHLKSYLFRLSYS